MRKLINVGLLSALLLFAGPLQVSSLQAASSDNKYAESICACDGKTKCKGDGEDCSSLKGCGIDCWVKVGAAVVGAVAAIVAMSASSGE